MLLANPDSSGQWMPALLLLPSESASRSFRNCDDDGSICLQQVLVRHAHYVFLGYRHYFVEPRIDQIWIVVVDGELADAVRAIEGALQAVDEGPPSATLGLLQFPISDRLLLQARDLFIDCSLDIFR